MAELQGVCTFPGVAQIVRASFTLSHGITPSAGYIEFAPQPGFVATDGELRFLFGSTAIRFPGCRLLSPTFTRAGGGMIARFQIQDRRWKWEHREISGRYNVRKEDGRFEEDTEEAPQELARKLLRAMGESNFSVSELPNETRPEIDWDFASPAQELAELCESLGCRVVLGLDNRVSIRKIGQGRPLPNLGIQMTEGYGASLQAIPDSLKFVAAPSLSECRLKLEAVGLDMDDKVKLVDDLSYMPTDGWRYQHPLSFGGVNPSNGQIDQAINLAKQTVWKWFRVKEQADASYPAQEFEKLWQILPLMEGRLKSYDDLDATTQYLPPMITGDYYDGNASGINTSAASGVGSATLKSRGYRGKFEVDRETGIVKFDEPVYKTSDANGIRVFTEPELYLTIAIMFRSLTTRQPQRAVQTERLRGRSVGGGTRIILREDVREQEVIEYDDTTNRQTSFESNRQALLREAQFTLRAAAAEYVTTPTNDIQYAGLLAINPDGAIQQVTWNVGPEGATTRASRNAEFNLAVPSYKERRRIERQKKGAEGKQKLLEFLGIKTGKPRSR